MAYNRRAKAPVFLLRFADDDLTGLEIRVRSTSTRAMIAFVALAAEFDAGKGFRELSKFDALFDGFIAALESWNLVDDDGRPVPATKPALLDQDLEFVLTVIRSWIDAVIGVPAPLGETSTGGEPPPDLATIPMEPLPASRAS